MRDSWRHFAAEFIGIFALVFVGGAAIMAAQMARTENVLLIVAAAHGLILAVMVTATMRISGHLNPAVTLGFLAARRIEPMMAMLFIVAQLLGATLAAYTLLWIFPHEAALGARLGGQSLALDISLGKGIALEAIATFFLVFVVFGTAVDPKAPKIGGLAIGLTVAADTQPRQPRPRVRSRLHPQGRPRGRRRVRAEQQLRVRRHQRRSSAQAA